MEVVVVEGNGFDQQSHDGSGEEQTQAILESEGELEAR